MIPFIPAPITKREYTITAPRIHKTSFYVKGDTVGSLLQQRGQAKKEKNIN